MYSYSALWQCLPGLKPGQYHWPGFDPDMTRFNKDACWRQLTFFCKVCFTHKATRDSEHFEPSFSIRRIKHDSSLASPNPERRRDTSMIWNCCHMLYFLSNIVAINDQIRNLEQNWEIHFHCHQGQAPSLTHVIQCRIRVRPRYLIKRSGPFYPDKMWPGWPGWPDLVSILVPTYIVSKSTFPWLWKLPSNYIQR